MGKFLVLFLVVCLSKLSFQADNGDSLMLDEFSVNLVKKLGLNDESELSTSEIEQLFYRIIVRDDNVKDIYNTNKYYEGLARILSKEAPNPCKIKNLSQYFTSAKFMMASSKLTKVEPPKKDL